MRRTIAVVLMLVAGLASWAQDDPVKVLTEREFLTLVSQFHPTARRAQLALDRGDQTLRRARGGFDPYLQGQYDRKRFDDKTYWDLAEGDFVIPGWFGTEVKAGYEYADGEFINPENNLPGPGLLSAGLKVPLGQGLFINERMAALQQARLFLEASESERLTLLNDLFFDALTAYWMWAEAEAVRATYESVLVLAQERFEATRTSYEQGDKPAIDTTESLLQVQQFTLERDAAVLNAQKMRLMVSNYLWTPQEEPLVLSENVVPESLMDTVPRAVPIDTLLRFLAQIDDTHPALAILDLEIASMEVERRLKIEKIKPKLTVEAGLLMQPREAVEGLNNYKVGVGFAMPLTARTARSDLQLQRIKIRETELKRDEKALELENKVRSSFIELQNLRTQIDQVRSLVQNYDRLARAERVLFSIGESSVFLVNSRDVKLLEARLKEFALRSKYRRSNAAFRWAAGVLGADED